MSHEHQNVDPAEANMDALQLLKHRMSRMQAALHNIHKLVTDVIPIISLDINYCMQVIEAIESHMPDRQAPQGAAAPAAAAPTIAARALPAKRVSAIEDAAAAAQAALQPMLDAYKSTHPNGAAAQPAHQPAVSASGARRPTVEGTQPTVAAAAPAAQAPNDNFGHFFGTGSIFSKFLSPTAFGIGRGFVEPGYGGMQQYTQDLTKMSGRDLEVNQWPNGFYRDETTRLGQLLLRSNKIQVIVTNLPHNEGPIYVSFAPFADRVDIRTLHQDQLAQVWGMAHAAFLAILRVGGDVPA
jgi:hypothetical protein